MRARSLGLVCGVILMAGGVAQAQERFDLRDWNRKVIANSPTVFYECGSPKMCGLGSAMSGRLLPKPAQPLTIESQRTREQSVARRMREQSEGRIKEVEVGETRETQIENLQFIYTDKRIVAANGSSRYDYVGVMVGKTRSFAIIASGSNREQTQNNFQSFARIVALILDQVALQIDTKPAEPAQPPAAKP